MGKYFEWIGDYETGDPTVDKQHQYLFKLGNRVQSTKPKDCKLIILELYRYTREHFTAEEEIMAEFKYNDLKNHKKLHENLISTLNDLADNFTDLVEDRNNLIAFFKNWIVNHILNEDLRFANFVASLENQD